ncbi:hypothetical protein SUGI_0463660 [Cryptomeria japonica]|uniref:uncharacterized protein At5g49945 n=1 Tax=Cryptomeria japonica TaxID=3369 RepID=UPI0024089F28|nr:uncharacterized protein At5g49945 [Cryptomeria japonica]GLJ24301.1 hypothetical protein SUGI_0463660 [Cryptomeria japonica]
MAKRRGLFTGGSGGVFPAFMAALLLRPDPRTLWWYIALLSALALLGQEIARSSAYAAEFEGFEGESDELDDEISAPEFTSRKPTPPPIKLTQSGFETDRGPPQEEQSTDTTQNPEAPESINPPQAGKPMPSRSPYDFWDEDEFEGLPTDTQTLTANPHPKAESKPSPKASPRPPAGPQSYYIEFFCVTFLIAFAVNFFLGRRENEKIALAWAAQFATKDGIFEKNFSLLGTGDGNDTPLLLKEGQNVFKFYASGRRYCQGLLATMELQSRHDLISRIYNCIIPCKDEVNIEVYMNDDCMDQIVFALARKKESKSMHKECKDLQQYANLLTPPSNRKWVTDELVAISESREVASDLILDTVLDQVFGEKAFEKYGKGFVSLYFTDQYPLSSHRKMLTFKFTLPSASKMADMTRLIAIVPYYIDLVGRYKLSTQTRNKAEAARTKVAKELYKEQQIARQEAIQRKKEERKKAMEETEAQLSAEAIRKREEKDRQRQMKKSMPRMRMTRVH